MGVIHFAEFSNAHGVPDSSSTSMDMDLDLGYGGDITHHKSSSRIGLTNFDLHRGIGGGKGKIHVVQEEGRQRSLLHGSSSSNSSLRGPAQSLDIDVHLLDGDEFILKSVSDESRQLSSHHKKAHARQYDSSTANSYAEKFADNSDTTVSSSSSSSSSSSYFNSQNEEDITPPVIRSTFPPANTVIGSHQTFGALITDVTGGSGVESACVQFKDHVNFRTACLDLSNVGGEDSDIWEQTFDGFELFHGKIWKYRVQSFDKSKNRRVTRWQTFSIDAGPSTPVETTTTTTTTSTITTNASTTVGASATKLMKEVRDENWPYDGKKISRINSLFHALHAWCASDHLIFHHFTQVLLKMPWDVSSSSSIPTFTSVLGPSSKTTPPIGALY